MANTSLVNQLLNDLKAGDDQKQRHALYRLAQLREPTALPVLLSLLMYGSPVIYPLQLVKDKLLTQQAAGEWSNTLYTLYTLNPLAGIIDGFQNVVLRNQPPDLVAMVPGAILVAVLLPLSYLYFKRAESYFADVI